MMPSLLLAKHSPIILSLFCCSQCFPLNVQYMAKHLFPFFCVATFPPLTDITQLGDFYYEEHLNYMRLSSPNEEGAQNFSWATHNKSVPLWRDSNSSDVLANFATRPFEFEFLVDEEANGYGDGLAFFMAPFDMEPPVNATGQLLGLFNETTNESRSIQIGLSASTGRNSTEPHYIYAWEIDPIESPPLKNSPGPIAGESPISDRTTNSKRHVILLSVVGCVVLVTISGFTLLLAGRWHANTMKNKRGKQERKELDKRFAQGTRNFTYADLRAATKNFSQDEILGKVGFGVVYRGILRGSNVVVAIKRISQDSRQGEKEYISEVTILSKLRHRNIVQLLGWCHEKRDLLLVYGFLSEGSLDKHLFGELGHLDWDRRYNIACRIASALVYLHDECDQRVVHRDIKASNIMLDANFNAKLGDFGLAREVERDSAASHTTMVAGTLGYVAPECVITGKASLESDVFRFGAVTLEIARGRRPVDRSLEDHNWRLVEWVWDLYGQGRMLDAVDAKLSGNFNVEEMQRVMLVGLLCSHPDPEARLTIRQVVDILKLKAHLPVAPLNYPVAVYGTVPGPVVGFIKTMSIAGNNPSIDGV